MDARPLGMQTTSVVVAHDAVLSKLQPSELQTLQLESRQGKLHKLQMQQGRLHRLQDRLQQHSIREPGRLLKLRRHRQQLDRKQG